MTSRSTASPSRFPSSAVPWILMRSGVTGFAFGSTGGTSVFTCAAAGAEATATSSTIAMIGSDFGSVMAISELGERLRVFPHVCASAVVVAEEMFGEILHHARVEVLLHRAVAV